MVAPKLDYFGNLLIYFPMSWFLVIISPIEGFNERLSSGLVPPLAIITLLNRSDVLSYDSRLDNVNIPIKYEILLMQIYLFG